MRPPLARCESPSEPKQLADAQRPGGSGGTMTRPPREGKRAGATRHEAGWSGTCGDSGDALVAGKAPHAPLGGRAVMARQAGQATA